MAEITLSPEQVDATQASIHQAMGIPTRDAMTAELTNMWERLDDISKNLMFEVINGMSRGRLSGEEVEAAEKRMRAGADKLAELESLVHLSNQRLYDALLAGEVNA